MTRRLGGLALALAAILLLTPAARAQGRFGRSGPAMTPDGPVWNPTQTPEWRQAGGNMEVYQMIMQQKMFQAQLKQQQQLIKQQQAFQKWMKDQKAKKDKGQPYDKAYDQVVAQMNRAVQVGTPPRTRHATTSRKTAKAKAKTKAATGGASSTDKADTGTTDTTAPAKAEASKDAKDAGKAAK